MTCKRWNYVAFNRIDWVLADAQVFRPRNEEPDLLGQQPDEIYML